LRVRNINTFKFFKFSINFPSSSLSFCSRGARMGHINSEITAIKGRWRKRVQHQIVVNNNNNNLICLCRGDGAFASEDASWRWCRAPFFPQSRVVFYVNEDSLGLCEVAEAWSSQVMLFPVQCVLELIADFDTSSQPPPNRTFCARIYYFKWTFTFDSILPTASSLSGLFCATSIPSTWAKCCV
jgi:hypothetical protein